MASFLGRALFYGDVSATDKEGCRAMRLGKWLGSALMQLCVALVVLVSPVRSTWADTGLVAKWSGDGNAVDSVSGRNGILMGTAVFGVGIVGSSFALNSNGWIDVADDPVWTLGSNAFTISTWVKFDALTGRVYFISHDDGSGNTRKWLFGYDPWGHNKQNNVPALRFTINDPERLPAAEDGSVPFCVET